MRRLARACAALLLGLSTLVALAPSADAVTPGWTVWASPVRYGTEQSWVVYDDAYYNTANGDPAIPQPWRLVIGQTCPNAPATGYVTWDMTINGNRYTGRQPTSGVAGTFTYYGATSYVNANTANIHWAMVSDTHLGTTDACTIVARLGHYVTGCRRSVTFTAIDRRC